MTEKFKPTKVVDSIGLNDDGASREIDFFSLLSAETTQDVVLNHLSKLTDDQRTKDQFTEKDIKSMIENGQIHVSSDFSSIEFPVNAVFKDVDFNKLVKDVPDWLQVYMKKNDIKSLSEMPQDVVSQMDARKKEVKTIVFRDTAFINCKIPKQSVIDDGSIVLDSYIGGNSIIKDSLVLGNTSTHHNCFVVDCESRYGVQFGISNKVISKMSYGSVNCNFDSDCKIIGGVLKGNLYESNVHIMESQKDNYNACVKDFLERGGTEYTRYYHGAPMKSAGHKLYDDGVFSHHAVIEFSGELNNPKHYPAHSLSKGEIDRYVLVRVDGDFVNHENIHATLISQLDSNLHQIKKEKLQIALNENKEQMKESVTSFLSEILPSEINLDVFVDTQIAPLENTELIENIVETSCEAMMITATESNSHKDLSNDHLFAQSISDMVNDHASKFHSHGKPIKVSREDIKRMVVDMVQNVPELKDFGIVSDIRLDSMKTSVWTGNHQFACQMTPGEYKKHKDRMVLHDLRSGKSIAKDSNPTISNAHGAQGDLFAP